MFAFFMSITLQAQRAYICEAPIFNGGGGVEVTCTAGGPGATSCSLTITTEVFGIVASETVSTSCGSGYYACCSQNSFGSAATAECIKI